LAGAHSELADLFELMHGAPEGFRTLRATVRMWRDNEVYRRADSRWVEQVRSAGCPVGTAGVLGCGDESDSARTWEVFESVWLERPNRLRLERQVGKNVHTTVRDGNRQWVYSPWSGASESEADGSAYEGVLTPLLRPLPAMAALGNLELVGEAVVAGREGVRIRALPRVNNASVILSAFIGPVEPSGDEIEFVLDRERGLMLRRESRLEGEPLGVIEFTRLELDRPLDPQVFVFNPPPGEHVRPREEAAAEQTGLQSLEQVAARASFTVFVPGMIWPRAMMHVSYTPSHERFKLKEHVWLTYFDIAAEPVSGGRLSLMERAPESELLPAGEWERVELDGIEAFVGTPTVLPFASSERGVETPLSVRMVREGTQIEIQGWGLERSELLGLARSLEPARTGPPPGFH